MLSGRIRRVTVWLATIIACVILFYSACSSAPPASRRPAPLSSAQIVDVTTQTKPFAPQSACAGTFVTHKLPFATGTKLREIGTYISNGSGVAVNDLDADGDLDLVFASVDGDSEILWNEGGLKFREEVLADKFTRGAAIVDVDGDGLLDIVFTHRGLEPPSWWRNGGGGDGGMGRKGDGESNPQPATHNPQLAIRNSQFPTRNSLPGADNYAYSMGWADLNGDGALDLVTGSYGAELKQHGIEQPEQESRAGIFLYSQENGQFSPLRMDTRSEALSVALLDLSNDRLADIWVANDFALQDLVWLRSGEKWLDSHLFDETSHSTMSIEWGNLDNHDDLALFTTDMNPYDISPQNMARWLPMMTQMGEHREAGDPQLMANTLQLRNSQGGWQNEAELLGVESSGWSWASQFGDLDQDGFLDLYVVNGMIAHDMFAHLDNDELIEENQAYRNHGDGSFERAPQWNLGSIASGRGMVMADMDGDGDLDIVVNNLRGLAELHENQLCSGNSITVDLRWLGSPNSFAVGARVTLQTEVGLMQRDVRASGGYLSDDATRLHFGMPKDAEIGEMRVFWPDGTQSLIANVTANTAISIVRK